MFFSKLFSHRTKSLRRLILYTGPALLVSMAYMDPGNYGTDIQAGASLNYSLLWVVWLSSGMAMLLQYLSGKLGIATGLTLPSYTRKIEEEKIHNTLLVGCRGCRAATDLAEVLGNCHSSKLAFWNTYDLWAIFGALDVLIILALATQRRFYIIERLFIIFVSIIGFGYMYEIFITKPDPAPILFSFDFTVVSQ